MQKLSRNKSVNFRVTQAEYDAIRCRQVASGIKNLRAYLLRQAVDGRVIHVELDSVKEMNRLLASVTKNITPTEIAEIIAQQKLILSDLCTLLGKAA